MKKSDDYDLITKIITHNEVWPYVSDDLNPDKEGYSPIVDESIHYLLTDSKDGVFIMVPVTSSIISAHSCLLPSARGKKTITHYRSAIDWTFKNTDYLKIIGMIPDYNKRALKAAVNAGFQIEGNIKESYLKGGKLMGQHIVGIGRSSWA